MLEYFINFIISQGIEILDDAYDIRLEYKANFNYAREYAAADVDKQRIIIGLQYEFEDDELIKCFILMHEAGHILLNTEDEESADNFAIAALVEKLSIDNGIGVYKECLKSIYRSVNLEDPGLDLGPYAFRLKYLKEAA